MIEGAGEALDAGGELFAQAAGAVIHTGDELRGIVHHDLFETRGAVFQGAADAFRTFVDGLGGFERIGNDALAHLLRACGQTVVDLDEDGFHPVLDRIGGFHRAGFEIGHAAVDKRTGLRCIFGKHRLDRTAFVFQQGFEIAETGLDAGGEIMRRAFEARRDIFTAHHDLCVELFETVGQSLRLFSQSGLQGGALGLKSGGEIIALILQGLRCGLDAALEGGIDLCGLLGNRAHRIVGGNAEVGLQSCGAFDQRIGGATGLLLHSIGEIDRGVFEQGLGFADLIFQRLGEAFGCTCEITRNTRRTHGNQLLKPVAARCNVGGEAFAAFHNARTCGHTGLIDFRRHRIALGGERVGDILARLTQSIRQRHGPRGHHFGDSATGGDDGGGDIFCARIHIAAQSGLRIFHGAADIIAAFGDFDDEGLSGLAHSLGDFACLAVQRFADLLGGAVDLAIDAVIGCDKALDQFMTAQRDLFDHVFAAIRQRAGNIFGALAQQHRNARTCIPHGGGEAVGSGIQFGCQTFMRTGNRLFQTVGLIDNGFALRGEIVDQRAQAHFILVIGGFNRRNFGVDDGFKLGGTRNRALDAVAHRRHFTADGLRQIEHGVRRQGFGFDHTHGHFGHGLGHGFHLLRAARQIGNTEHRSNGQSETNCGHHPFGLAHGREEIGQTPSKLFTRPIAGRPDPAKAWHQRPIISAHGGCRLQILQNFADFTAVIIGRTRRRRQVRITTGGGKPTVHLTLATGAAGGFGSIGACQSFQSVALIRRRR